MQVSIPAGPTVPSSDGRVRIRLGTTLPWLAPVGSAVLAPFAAVGGERELQRERAAESQRRRDEHNEAIAIDQAGSPRPADQMQAAERDGAVGSRAFARADARQQADQRYVNEKLAFRRSLHAARDSIQRNAQPPAAQSPATSDADAAAARGAESPVAASPQTARPTTTPAASDATRESSPSNASPSQPVAAPKSSPASSAITTPPPPAAYPTSPTQTRTGGNTARPVDSASPSGTTSTADGRAPADKPVSSVTSAISGTSRTRDEPREAQAAAKAAPPDPADAEATIDRIVRHVRQKIGLERSTTVLHLNPEALGKIRLELDLRKDALSLRIDTHSELAHRLLSEDIDRLRSGLDAAGVQLQRVEIVPPSGDATPRQGEPGAEERRRGRSRNDTAGRREQPFRAALAAGINVTA